MNKSRSEMTEYERAIDWRDRLSPRWWRFCFALVGLAGVLMIGGIALQIAT